MNIDDRLPSPQSVRKRVVWTMVVIGVGLGASLLARQMESGARRGTEFQAYVERLRAAGEPTTLIELCGPPPPAADNSAPEITAALKSLDEAAGPERKWKVTGPWDGTLADDGAPWYERASPEQIRELDEFLGSIRPFFDRVAAAADRPRCWFPFDVDEHGVTQSAGVPSLQRLTRVFGARACVASDPTERIEACRTLCVLSRRFEPVQPIGHMVRAAMTSAATTALRHGVETGAIDAASARTRLDPLLAPTWLDVHSRFVTSELVQNIAEFQAMLDGRTPPSEAMEISTSDPAIFAGQCEIHREASRWLTRPYADYLRRARKSIESARGNDWMLGVLIPKVAATLGMTEAKCRLARVALAVAEHRATRGDFPASLDELKPMFPDGVPLDPYMDAPFVYERLEAGARVASVGRLSEDEPLDDATLRERCLVWELKR